MAEAGNRGQNRSVLNRSMIHDPLVTRQERTTLSIQTANRKSEAGASTCRQPQIPPHRVRRAFT